MDVFIIDQSMIITSNIAAIRIFQKILSIHLKHPAGSQSEIWVQLDTVDESLLFHDQLVRAIHGQFVKDFGR